MYPSKGIYGLDNLLLSFVGCNKGSDGTKHPQYFTFADLQPIITHINPITNKADDEMFTDFLFMAVSIEDKNGNIKYIVRNDTSPANYDDWEIYKNELFSAGKNLNALYSASIYNGLNKKIDTDVWIGYPFPHPKIFGKDPNRVANVCKWIDSFLSTWNQGNYSSRLNLRGFYCVQECEYYNQYSYDDGRMMTLVNNYIHNKGYKSLWIPYAKANGNEKWNEFNYDLCILQPSYYFKNISLDESITDAYINGQGVEMEFELSILYNADKRKRFIEYLNKIPQYTTVGWYIGGWYWNNNTRNHALLKLYQQNDILYDKIYEFCKGKYIGM